VIAKVLAELRRSFRDSGTDKQHCHRNRVRRLQQMAAG